MFYCRCSVLAPTTIIIFKRPALIRSSVFGLFQVCTQWGYFTTAPPDQKMPRIVFRLLTLGYQSKICKQAFPPKYSVPSLPNITAVDALGDFDIAADRSAIIDGEVDPWRAQATLRPFKIIPNGVHHHDELGVENLLDEPPKIRKIHAEMIAFVNSWLKDWNVELTRTWDRGLVVSYNIYQPELGVSMSLITFKIALSQAVTNRHACPHQP